MTRLILALIAEPFAHGAEHTTHMQTIANDLQQQNPDLEVQWICADKIESIFTADILEKIG